jgi:general secretion pathway protein J
MEPVRVKLLTQVRTVRFRFMNASREWVDRWPATDGTALTGSERLRPAAVEVTLELEDWGVIRRVIEVAG